MLDDIDQEEELAASWESSITLMEGECWVGDPDYLWPESGVEGVLAIQYRGGELFYLDGATRKWLNVESSVKKGSLRPVN